MSTHNCILCGAGSLVTLGQVSNRRFHNTEIHKTIPVKSTIYQCEHCGHTQKYHGPKDLEALKILYDNYTVANFSLQVTQSIFIDSKQIRGVRAKTREDQVLDQCGDIFINSRDILDIGCGTGSFLKNFGQRFPATRLHAYEVTESLKEQLLAIENVVSFNSGALSDLPQNSYDFITLWQCLEHLDSPGTYLACIHKLLRDNGHLLIQVPDLERMPFDLAVFEHWSHFCNSNLIEFAQSCGFELIRDGSDWVHNCSTIILRKSEASQVLSRSKTSVALQQLTWVNQTAKFFQDGLNDNPGEFLILGVGTAAGWLYGLLDQRPMGFLEEDQSRVGLAFDQLPIISAQSAPEGITVLIPFAVEQAFQIKNRLLKSNSNLRKSIIICPQESY